MLAAHELFVVRRPIAFRKDDPVKWFEIVAAIKVDKSSRHNSLPAHGSLHPCGTPKRRRLLQPGHRCSRRQITADFPGT